MTTFVACLALSGCSLDLALDVDLEPDGGGRLAVALAADREALASAREAGGGVGGGGVGGDGVGGDGVGGDGVGGDPLGLLAAAGQDLADEGWTVTDVTAPDGTRQVELAVSADDAEALSAQATRLADALSAPEVALLDPLSVTLTDDRILVSGGASLEPGPAVADYGLDGAEAVRLVERGDALGYTVRITMPAEVLASNATAVEASTLEWTVEPGQRVPITAEGVRPRFPWPLAGAAAAVALLFALPILVAVRRRRRRSSIA